MTKRSIEAESLENGYELSVEAFEQVHERKPLLGGEDSAWIRGWQSGFARAAQSVKSKKKPRPRGS